MISAATCGANLAITLATMDTPPSNCNPLSTPPMRLPLPPAEYGAVRKVLEEKTREGVVHPQERILGL